jgi:hypothetical protein
LALGHAQRVFHFNLAWLGLLGLGLGGAMALHGEVTVVAVAVSAVSVLLCVWRNVITLRLCRAPLVEAVRAISPALGVTGVMAVVVALFKFSLDWPAAGWLQVIEAILLGIITYGLMSLSFLPELRSFVQRWWAVRWETDRAGA